MPADQARREKRAHGTQAFPFQIYSAPQARDSDLVPYHWHPELEIIAVLSGTVRVGVEDSRWEGRPGDVFFVGAGQLHEIGGGVENRFRAFVFPTDFLQFRRTDRTQTELLGPLEEGQLALPDRLAGDSPAGRAVYAELMAMLAANEAQPAGYELLIKASLLRILALLAGAGLLTACPDRTSGYRTQQLRAIVEYLNEHCTEQLRLADVAGRFGLSPKYFCAFFKENLGRTLMQHINFLRIERASRLLRETDQSILEISLSVGFENVSYFIRRFREVYGCTPTAYRQSRR